MSNINKLVCLFLIAVCCGCSSDSNTEKHQNKRDKIILVQDKVKEIEIEDVLIGQVARVYLLGDYLIIKDYMSVDKIIHLFDKKNFNYVTSTADRGQGPGEITNPGHVGSDESRRIFYVNDHGKQAIFAYELDSVLANPDYLPKVKMKMDKMQHPDKYQYINDTLSIGLIIEPIGNSDFKQVVAKWNMNTGEIKPMKYEHPAIEKKRISFDVSMEHGIYVECHSNHDLMTICNLNGDLKYNIYGPNWSDQQDNLQYYTKVIFCKDRIVASYSGGIYGSDERFATKFFVFDIAGNYIQTLETGYRISDFCYDKENNRIIMSLNADIQFAYLDMEGVIK
jgi:hypothetical protein